MEYFVTRQRTKVSVFCVKTWPSEPAITDAEGTRDLKKIFTKETGWIHTPFSVAFKAKTIKVAEEVERGARAKMKLALPDWICAGG